MIKPMLCGIYKKGKIPLPCFVQPKLDGVRCLLNSEQAYTRNGKPHKPHIQKLLSHVMPDCDSGVTYDGELMLPGATFQETISVVKKDRPGITDKLEYFIYDFHDDDTPDMDFNNRNGFVDIMKPMPNVTIVPTYMAVDEETVDLYHRDFVKQGYEGTIIRDPLAEYMPGSRRAMWKRKDMMDAEFHIVDVVEGEGKNTGTPVYECCCENGRLFRCVPIGSYERKRELWEDRLNIINRVVTVRFQEYTDDGVPRFPVAVEIRDYE